MTKRNKLLVTILCLACVLCALVSGTIAWLISASGPITNTFTPSNVKVELNEENKGVDYKFQMIPGKTYAKDPKVIVTTDINCYVFVKVVKAGGNVTVGEQTYGFDDFMTCAMADGWVALDGVEGVYYREVTTSTSAQPFYVLAGNNTYSNGIVTVNPTVTKDMMDALIANTSEYPTLTFTAYAIQKEGFADAAAAWAAIPNP